MDMTPEEYFLLWVEDSQFRNTLLPRLPADIFSKEGRVKVTGLIRGEVPSGSRNHASVKLDESKAMAFVQSQLLNLVARRATTGQKSGKLDDLFSIVRLLEECNHGFGALPIDSFDLIVPERREVIPTGVAPLDKQIMGLARGELGIIFMPPGKGKTLTLINFTVSALLNGHSVHYITVADQGKHELVPRIDTCILGTPGRPDIPVEELRERHAIAVKTIQNRLWISDFTALECSIYDLERVIDHCESNLVIVDHADDVLSPYSTDPTVTRHSLRVVYLALKKLAVRYNIPIWTASQSSEMSWFMRSTGVGDMSEAKVGKATGAAIILGFSGGPINEQQPGIVMCTIAKARRFYTERTFFLRVDFEKMRIW